MNSHLRWNHIQLSMFKAVSSLPENEAQLWAVMIRGCVCGCGCVCVFGLWYMYIYFDRFCLVFHFLLSFLIISFLLYTHSNFTPTVEGDDFQVAQRIRKKCKNCFFFLSNICSNSSFTNIYYYLSNIYSNSLHTVCHTNWAFFFFFFFENRWKFFD